MKVACRKIHVGVWSVVRSVSPATGTEARWLNRMPGERHRCLMATVTMVEERVGRDTETQHGVEPRGDEGLLAAVASRDKAAFRLLYERHAERVFRFAMSIVRRTHLAEDVLQETMIVVWRRAKSFKGESKVSTWILGIARNLAFNLLRKEKRGDRLPEERPNDGNPAKQIETTVQVERALRTLPDHHREVMHLVFYEDMSLREAAEVLGIPEGTVKSRMHHARKALAKELSR